MRCLQLRIQWFHFAVVSAALLHLYAMRLLIEWRDASGGGCLVPFNTRVPPASAAVDLMHVDMAKQLLQKLAKQHLTP